MNVEHCGLKWMLAIEPPCVFDVVAYLFLCCAIRIAVLAWQFVAESMCGGGFWCVLFGVVG